MANINNTLNISQDTRPCLVTVTHRNSLPEEVKAFFYGVFQRSEVITINSLKGERQRGGQDADVVAVVEFEDGRIGKVPVERVRLLDSPEKFWKHRWGEERNCDSCKHRFVTPEKDPCRSCGRGMSGYKAWEAAK